jgi:membrane peptidoglycan carboxypeptidase
VYAGDSTYGRSTGFQAGSTFKIFTLVDWLEKGHSVNEVLNGNQRIFKKIPNSCDGDWINYANESIYNFGRVGGRTGTPMQFTAASLNTGYLAMAEQLDLCDIGNVAKKMGVIRGDGQPLDMKVATSVIGINNVSPMAMASAYATVANNGVYCQPQVIDRVTNSKGEELVDKKPVKTCEQVLTAEVAATAAYALQGVMTGGGTGVQGNPRDGTPLLGKTGTHEEIQTWMIESSSKVTTAAWVGNTLGENSVFNKRFKGVQLSNIRYTLARDVQRAADAAFGGDAFPKPDTNLSRQVLRDVPNVVGQAMDQAQATLEEAGFTVQVGDPVDSDQAAGLVGTQNPSGRAAAGATIVISPSNGQGVAVPPVAGASVADATSALQRAGFTNLSGSCSVNGGSPDAGLVQGTNPAAGTVTNPSTPIAISYTAKAC